MLKYEEELSYTIVSSPDPVIRELTIKGYDLNNNKIEETLILNGTAPVKTNQIFSFRDLEFIDQDKPEGPKE